MAWEISETLNRLYSLQKFGIKLGLENTYSLLKYLGEPHKKFRSFHIAGTNGKGSTSSFIASILMEKGYKTGLYTSPHFVKFNERIKICPDQIDDEYICSFFSDVEDFVIKHKLTFFEVTTVMAFKYFADKQVDFAVVETGLGGRLDSTNVLQAEAAVITSISLEHIDVLGDTIEKIAEEKAGIVKYHKNVFAGKLPQAALSVISKRCMEKDAELFSLKDYLNEKEEAVSLVSKDFMFEDISPALKGKYQKYNAALALLSVCKTIGNIEEATVKKAFENVLKNTGIEGRYEYYCQSPKIIFDSAHNVEGITNFLDSFKKEVTDVAERIIIFGAMKDKHLLEMLRLLSDNFDAFYFTQINYERCASAGELIKLGRLFDINGQELDNPAEFIEKFKNSGRDACLVVLGSMYVLGEIKAELQNKKSS